MKSKDDTMLVGGKHIKNIDAKKPEQVINSRQEMAHDYPELYLILSYYENCRHLEEDTLIRVEAIVDIRGYDWSEFKPLFFRFCNVEDNNNV